MLLSAHSLILMNLLILLHDYDPDAHYADDIQAIYSVNNVKQQIMFLKDLYIYAASTRTGSYSMHCLSV